MRFIPIQLEQLMTLTPKCFADSMVWKIAFFYKSILNVYNVRQFLSLRTSSLMAVVSEFFTVLLMMLSTRASMEGFSECWAWMRAGHTCDITAHERFVAMQLLFVPSKMYSAPFGKKWSNRVLLQRANWTKISCTAFY